MKFNKISLSIDKVNFADGYVGLIYIERHHAVCDDHGNIQTLTLSGNTGEEINLVLQPNDATRSHIVNFLETIAVPFGLMYLGNKMFQDKNDDNNKKQVSMVAPFMYNQTANGFINPVFRWVRAHDSSYFDMSTHEMVIKSVIRIPAEYLT